MGEVLSQRDRLRLVSISRLAELLGMDRKTVAKRLSDCNVQPTGKRDGYPVYDGRQACEACLLPQLNEDEEGRELDPRRMKPTDRKAWFASELDRMAVEERAGRLIPAGEVEEQMAMIVSTVVRCLETQADRAERDLRVGTEVVEWLLKDADQIRAQIAEALTEDEDDDAVRLSG
jgi:hypothetical protein